MWLDTLFLFCLAGIWSIESEFVWSKSVGISEQPTLLNQGLMSPKHTRIHIAHTCTNYYTLTGLARKGAVSDNLGDGEYVGCLGLMKQHT